ncbi:MAG: hypothetical protein K0R57_6065 [Paenibacillaceae bacterium]|jgi:ApbE superfamily uncharacterized protein (UPF0280 family)|nr:hypothetical protein [Paenibacillaceae bacterium]
MNDAVRILDGGRVLIDYGPVTMTLLAENGGKPRPELCCAAFGEVERVLTMMGADLPLLRRPPLAVPRESLSESGQRMLDSVRSTGDPELTPMAAVAGTVADRIADYLAARGAERVMVNNGGDIALRLVPGCRVRVGIMPNLGQGRVAYTADISAESGIRGICTSGLGGRSFTRGIADSVTVFSHSASMADALATHLANATFLEDEAVKTVLAGELDPDSDISMLSVVTRVGPLSPEKRQQALEQFCRAAAGQAACMAGAIAFVQGDMAVFPSDLADKIALVPVP